MVELGFDNKLSQGGWPGYWRIKLTQLPNKLKLKLGNMRQLGKPSKKKDKLGLLDQPRGGEGLEGPWSAQPS